MTLVDAASRIRDAGGRPTDIRSLFTQSGENRAEMMTFEEDADETNPPRQVIINTHSPVIVRCSSEESLVLAKSAQFLDDSGQVRLRLQSKQLPGTWRMAGHPQSAATLVTKGELPSYLGGGLPQDAGYPPDSGKSQLRLRLVAERDDMHLNLV